MTNKSGSWNKTTVDSVGGEYRGQFSSIALESNGNVHIGYYGKNYVGGGWNQGCLYSASTVSTGGWVKPVLHESSIPYMWNGSGTSLALDGAIEHISYYSDGGYLKYATNALSSWQTYTVDYTGTIGSLTWSSIAIDSTNEAHIGYYNAANKVLKYATGSPRQLGNLYHRQYRGCRPVQFIGFKWKQ